MRELMVAACVVCVAAPASAEQTVDLSKPITPEQYQGIILNLCQGARYASHVAYDDICDKLRDAFAAWRAQQPAPEPAPEPASK